MTLDTGLQLRSLYELQGGVGEIFSSKVADYVSSRPDYPAALFDVLQTEAYLFPGAAIADIGAGTGLLTKRLLERNYQVLAVEPNKAMREAADKLLSHFSGYRSIDGTAESIPIPAQSIDLITAAQAFHWFEVDAARVECLRVLRPSGQIALIWNDRLLSDPLHIALNELFAQYGGAKRGALVAHEDRRSVAAFFGSTIPTEYCWEHEHVLDKYGLQSLVFSRSYMPERSTPEGQDADEKLRQLFVLHSKAGQVVVRYTTVAMVGRPR